MPAFTLQPQSVIVLWRVVVLILHPAEYRKLSWPAGWLHTEVLIQSPILALIRPNVQ